MEKNLTTGSVFKNIILFSIPYMLSFFLQTLYGLADLYIVGKFDGTACITSVSIGSQIMHMATVMIVGLAMGSTVSIARAIGENRFDKASKSIGNTITLFVIASIVITGILLLLVNPIVSVMSTPVEAVNETRKYITICFIGIPFITSYNIIASIFRGLGDSKSPMYFVAIACVLNIGLDFFFIGTLDLGASGAALGTTISQTFSVIIALVSVRKRTSNIKLHMSDFKIDKSVTGAILKVGIPISLQEGFIQISFLVITIIANKRGLNDAAAVGIVEKVICMLFIIPSSLLSSVSALASQNLGARKLDRAHRTLKYAILINTVYGILIGIMALTIPEKIVSIFEDNQDVITLGGQYLTGYGWDALFAGTHFCFSGYFCACEKSGYSFMHNSLSIIFVRIPFSYLLSIKFASTLFPMGCAAPMGSVFSIVICIIIFVIISKEEKEKYSLINKGDKI